MKNYIEYRVYLKPTVDFMDADAAAEELKDFIVDQLSPEQGAPPFFTQDVTYTVKYEVTDNEIQ